MLPRGAERARPTSLAFCAVALLVAPPVCSLQLSGGPRGRHRTPPEKPRGVYRLFIDGVVSRVLVTDVPPTVESPAPQAEPAEEEELCSVVPAPLPRALPAACLMLASPDGCATVNGQPVPPDSCVGGYYGHDSSLDPEWAIEHGLKARGDDWDLLRHALQEGNSAFRGTTQLVTFPDGNGAASWADEGGYVYELCCVPSWDVNKHTQGRRLVSDLAVPGGQRYADNPAFGEHEHAVPARVPTEHIKRYGRVVISAGGMAYVPRSAWVDNPHFNQAFCKYSMSECGEE